MNIKRIISTAILLLISFWFTDLLAAQYFPSDIDLPPFIKASIVSRYSKVLASMKESPLWPLAKDRNKVSYRFIYLPAIREPIVLRLDLVNKTKWLLTVKKDDYSPSNKDFAVNQRKRVAKEEVDQFRELFTQLQFWELPTAGAFEAEYSIFDGTVWLLEAVENGRYHLIRRMSPTLTVWEPPPLKFGQGSEKMGEGYPSIDRATSEEVNKRLVAVGKFLVKLSGLELKVY